MDLKRICACCNGSKTEVIENDALFLDNGPWTVLYYADSKVRSDLEVEQERDEIRRSFKEGARKSQCEDMANKVTFDYYFNRSINELVRIVHELQPVVLHLACHGEKDGSITIGGRTMKPDELAERLSSIVDECKLRLVVLNFCFSGIAARKLMDRVDFVIGHETEVDDQDAVTFAKHLYYFLGNNKTLREAVKCTRPA
eukprot:755838-Hanusia_phi.AAC.1